MQDDAQLPPAIYLGCRLYVVSRLGCCFVLLYFARCTEEEVEFVRDICMYDTISYLEMHPQTFAFLPLHGSASPLIALSLGVLLIRKHQDNQNWMFTTIYLLQRNIFFFMRRADWNWSCVAHILLFLLLPEQLLSTATDLQ